MLVVLIGALSVLLVVSYLIFDRDFMAPSTVVSAGFLLGALCTRLNEEKWGLEFSSKTTVLVTAGIAAMIIGGIIAVLLSNGFRSFEFGHVSSDVGAIEIERIKTLLIVIFQMVTFVLLFLQIRRFTGYSNWVQAVKRYREISVEIDSNDELVSLPFALRNMVELSFIIAFVYAYIIGNNFGAKKKQPILNLLPVIMYALMTIIQGARAELIRVLVVFLLTFYFVRKRKEGWKKTKETVKMLVVIVIITAGAVVLFSEIRKFAGRPDTDDALDHVTFYAGCPLAAFDEFLKRPIEKLNLWGAKTFFNLYRTLYVFFGWPPRYSFYSDFITSPTGKLIGNTYTVLKTLYMDFGFWGTLIGMMTLGVFYTSMYCRLRSKPHYGSIDLGLLLYGIISFSYFMYFYSGFHPFMSHTFIKQIIELLVLRWVLLNVQFVRHYEFIWKRTQDEQLSSKKYKYLKQ